MFCTILFIVAVILVVFGFHRTYRLHACLERTLDQHAQQDTCLDYVLRTYSLHIKDPYVVRPGYEERRCYHCHYPLGEGHNPACPWLAVQSVTRQLYP